MYPLSMTSVLLLFIFSTLNEIHNLNGNSSVGGAKCKAGCARSFVCLDMAILWLGGGKYWSQPTGIDVTLIPTLKIIIMDVRIKLPTDSIHRFWAFRTNWWTELIWWVLNHIDFFSTIILFCLIGFFSGTKTVTALTDCTQKPDYSQEIRTSFGTACSALSCVSLIGKLWGNGWARSIRGFLTGAPSRRSRGNRAHCVVPDECSRQWQPLVQPTPTSTFFFFLPI